MDDREKNILETGDEQAKRQLSMSRESIERMNTDIIDNINAVVYSNATLWILGDLGFFKHHDSVQKTIDKINCKNIYYVMGNHDKYANIHPCVAKTFDQVLIQVEGQYIVLNHYPMLRWDHSHRGSWNLFGHCHCNVNEWIENRMPEAKMLDVGVDGHNYKPWSFEEVQAYMDTKKGEGIFEKKEAVWTKET